MVFRWVVGVGEGCNEVEGEQSVGGPMGGPARGEGEGWRQDPNLCSGPRWPQFGCMELLSGPLRSTATYFLEPFSSIILSLPENWEKTLVRFGPTLPIMARRCGAVSRNGGHGGTREEGQLHST